MSAPLAQPKVYHITHIDNLPGIVATGLLLSDAARIESGADCTNVGMSTIKRRRLKEIEVACHPGTKVGEYVPFFFCPRSIMLFILWRANHPDLEYRGGQKPIVHLQLDLRAIVHWANGAKRKWAFSDRNAGTYLASFYNDLGQLNLLDWEAIRQTDFRDPVVKESKQAEFLVHQSVPWQLVETVGVESADTATKMQAALSASAHKPLVKVEPSWYY